MELYVPNITTKNTPILTYYDMDVKSVYDVNNITCCGKILYRKPFNFNELIGEYLAKKINLKTAQYFIYYNIPRNTYHIASTDFKEETKQYFQLENLPIPYQDNHILDDIIKNQNEELLDHLLSMFALDYYMLQHDRDTHNYVFEQKEDNNFDLAPLYDYSDSLDATCYYHYDKVVNQEGFYHYYDNGLIILEKQEDFDKMFEKYPIFKQKLKDMTEINLSDIILQIEQDFSIDIGEDARESYKKDEEISQKILRKVLK